MESKSNPSRGSSFVDSARGSSSGASRTPSSRSAGVPGDIDVDSYIVTTDKDQNISFNSTHLSASPSADEYGPEQYEDYDVRPKPACAKRWSRVTALFLGLAVLASVGLGLFFWMDKEDVEVKKVESAAIEEADLKEIPLVELEQHNEPQDCWLAIHGFVWDLTEYGAFRLQILELFLTTTTQSSNRLLFSLLIIFHCSTGASRRFRICDRFLRSGSYPRL